MKNNLTTEQIIELTSVMIYALDIFVESKDLDKEELDMFEGMKGAIEMLSLQAMLFNDANDLIQNDIVNLLNDEQKIKLTNILRNA